VEDNSKGTRVVWKGVAKIPRISVQSGLVFTSHASTTGAPDSRASRV